MAKSEPTRVVLIGAGFISQVHLQALRYLRSKVRVTGICDVELERARSVARAWGLEASYADTNDVIEARPDAVHVLVPPPLHARVATPFLEAGIDVLLEKPLAPTVAECDRLIEAAQRGNARLGVNHNATYYPIFQKLLRAIEARRYGRVQHVRVLVNLPLRQLDAGQFHHWMFAEPGHIVLEQATHPFSQIVRLLGAVREVHTVASDHRVLVPGREFYGCWQFALECERGTADVTFRPGGAFPENRIHVVGQDGSAELDLVHRVFTERTKHPREEFTESFAIQRRVGRAHTRAAWGNLADSLASLVKLKKPGNLFFQGMLGSLDAFHTARREGRPLVADGNEGRAVVELCERATRQLPKPLPAPPPHPAPPPRENETLVLGATGFIGRHLIPRLIAEGHAVRILVRRTNPLAPELNHPDVRILKGDLTDRDSLASAIRGCRTVIHMATGEGNDFATLQRTMIGGTRAVAELCAEHGVERLLFTSTIACYYLGGHEPITEETPLDPKFESRSLYARAKVVCERELQRIASEKNLPVLVFRPGVVVGRFGRPNHSGLGLWLHDTQCIGWGKGDVPMPFVLAEDVADALVLGTRAPLDGLRSFNLVGDVRPTAREYLRDLGDVWERNVRFVPSPVWKAQIVEIVKWLVKRAIGRKDAPFPSLRDLKTRALRAPFDCTRTKQVLGWNPVSDRATFHRLGIACYGTQGTEGNDAPAAPDEATVPSEEALAGAPRP